MTGPRAGVPRRPRTATTPLTLAVLLAVTSAGAGPAPRAAGTPSKAEAELPPLNAKVLEFARSRLGEKVGTGQCASLAIEALRRAGAKRFPITSADGDYVWGRPIGSFREALPGDVVQFRDAVFRGRTPLPGRRWVTWRHEYPHHTAVVSQTRDGGKLVVLLHQNVGGEGTPDEVKQRVTQTTLRVDSLQKGGCVWIYRPVGRDDPAQ